MFGKNFTCMVHIFGFSLDVTVMINILQEIIKIMLNEILKAINLYWFNNDASEKNISLSDLFNESPING